MNIIKNIDKKVVLYILLAFIFSIAIRLIWVYQFHDYEEFIWNNQLMINTNDGYYYAEGARDILAGFHQPNDLSPVHVATSKLTAWIAMVLPFSFESIILYLPAFLSSLIVIPLILIGKNLKSLELGLIAALLASIAWSYYNRTMVGYYDTDMLNVVFPTFILYIIILAVQTKEKSYLLALPTTMILYSWWYPGAYSLHFAFLGLLGLYTVFYFFKEAKKNWHDEAFIYLFSLIVFMLFAMLALDVLLRFVIIVVLFALFIFKKDIFVKSIYIIASIALVLFFIKGGFDPIWHQLKGYVFRDITEQSTDILKLHFFTVMQTVREAGSIPFEVFANRISGNVITFLLSILGYVYLCFKHRVMLLALPMVGLGFLAYTGGLRFTVYAVPPMALGIGFLIVKLSELADKKSIKYLFMAFATFFILLPNVLHVRDYRVPTVFNKQEVRVLDNLKKSAAREDYVVSWWDYGYPIRYYADVKTLVDGAKHSGEVNFAPSFILTHTQQEAAKMARLDVEYTELAFKEENSTKSNIAKMTKEYGFSDVNDFLVSLGGDINLPPKTRDIYLFLPYRMMGIFPTVARFSYLDLMSAKAKKQPFFFQSNSFRDSEQILELSKDVAFDKATSHLNISGTQVPVKSFFVLSYDESGKVVTQTQNLHQNGALSVVFARAYNSFFVFDESALNSTYIQLFLFENYDKNLFEPVELNPYVKVYKLKK